MLKSAIAAAVAGIVLFAAVPAAAEVVERHADGFTLRFEVAMETTPEDLLGSLGEIGKWWDGAHSYSGDAANMTLAMQPGGCFCEALTDGTAFEHGRVVSINPATGVLLNAPLGPLKATATKADLGFGWASGNRGWTVVMTFMVEGPGLGAFADPVDGVMGGAFARYVRYVRYVEYGEG